MAFPASQATSIFLSAADFIAEDSIVQLGYPPNRIDILTSISGCTFDEVWAGKVQGQMDGLPVNFIGKTQFITNKRASGRAKDLADLEALL